jgi:hypothetical protein
MPKKLTFSDPFLKHAISLRRRAFLHGSHILTSRPENPPPNPFDVLIQLLRALALRSRDLRRSSTFEGPEPLIVYFEQSPLS